MKVKCGDFLHCGWVGDNSALLRAPDPFGDGEVTACPKCKQIDQCVGACDEPGCEEFATCGTPTESGYRTTCHWHKPEA